MQYAPLTLARLVDRYQFADLVPLIDVAEDLTVSGVASSDEAIADARDTLVLGIGVRDAEDALQQIREWTKRGAAAFVLRPESAPEVAALGSVLNGSSLVVLTLGEAMPWLRFSALVVAELEGGASPTDTSVHAPDELELFELADSIAALVDGPVTIEDLASTILAFSSDQDRADAPRQRSILERRVSHASNEILTSEGVFERLYGSAEPLFLKTTVQGSRPRAAIRIKAGDELLGSIWAVVDGPLSQVQARGMQEASGVVALTLMRRRLTEEAHSQELLSQVSRLIEGGSGAATAALELGLGDAPSYVIAIRRTDDSRHDTASAHARRSLARMLSTFISSANSQSAVAEVHGVIYAVIAVRGATAHPEESARQFVGWLARHAPRDGVTMGYGDPVSDITQLARSRRQADVALRVGSIRSDGTTGVVAWRDVQVDGLLHELVDAMISRHEGIAQPLSRVIGAEERSGLPLVSTLSAYLENLGDIASAAASLFVHPNTFRYRLRKLEAEANVNLKDRQTRFELFLQLRLLAHRDLMHSAE